MQTSPARKVATLPYSFARAQAICNWHRSAFPTNHVGVLVLADIFGSITAYLVLMDIPPTNLLPTEQPTAFHCLTSQHSRHDGISLEVEAAHLSSNAPKA